MYIYIDIDIDIDVYLDKYLDIESLVQSEHIVKQIIILIYIYIYIYRFGLSVISMYSCVHFHSLSALLHKAVCIVYMSFQKWN